jgi:uncharacterized protein related to proFAR isomerase
MDTQIARLRTRIEEITEQMRDSQVFSIDLDLINSPKDVLTAFQEDVNARKQLVEDILPKDLESMKRHVSSLESIDSSSLTSNFLQRIHERINSVNGDINKLMEEKSLKDNSMDDKIALFQQNVRLISPSQLSQFLLILFIIHVETLHPRRG